MPRAPLELPSRQERQGSPGAVGKWSPHQEPESVSSRIAPEANGHQRKTARSGQSRTGRDLLIGASQLRSVAVARTTGDRQSKGAGDEAAEEGGRGLGDGG